MTIRPQDGAVKFIAVDRYVETNIVAPTEVSTHGSSGRILWGKKNDYPHYLLALYRDVASLGSIVNGSVDYVAGNGATLRTELFPTGKVNRKGELAIDIVRGVALDWFIYGGFALEVIRGLDGRPAEINVLGMENLRTNKDCTVFWYSEKWDKGGRDALELPAFMPDLDWATLDADARNRHASSVLFVKNTRKQTYPLPIYAQAVKACEIERCIDEYHLNSINNGFAADVIVSMNNGVPADDVKKEIEKDIQDKFTGQENAGRFILTFAPDRQHSMTVTPLQTADFGQKYDALYKRSRQQIFTSFRANPNLFGIPTESLGFSDEEYRSAFDLYNRTQIRPVQDRIIDAFDRICGGTGVLTIAPFSLAENAAPNTVE